MPILYQLQHVHTFESGEVDMKELGVFSSVAAAEAAQSQAVILPGFCESPEDFRIVPYPLDDDDTDGPVPTQIRGLFFIMPTPYYSYEGAYLDDADELELIGFYSDTDKAEHALALAQNRPEYLSRTKGHFKIFDITVGQRAWTEGYFTA